MLGLFAVVAVTSLAASAEAATWFAAVSVETSGGDVRVTRQVNNVGLPNTVARIPGTIGSYSVTFGGMFSPTLPRTVQVSSASTTVACSTGTEGSIDANLIVAIHCYATDTGQPRDTRFTAVFRMDSSLNGDEAGYVRSTGHVAFSAWNSRGGPITMTHPTTGRYTFTFGALTQTNQGTVLITTRTAGTKCAIERSSIIPGSGTTVSVLCAATTTTVGTRKDANLSVYVGRRPIVSSSNWGFVRGDQPTLPSYAPFFQGTSNGQQVTIIRRMTGVYDVTFPALPPGGAGHFLLVAPFTNPDLNCLAFFGGVGPPATVRVDCLHNGALVDARFALTILGP